MREIKTAALRGRDELAEALKAFPQSINQSHAHDGEHYRAQTISHDVHIHSENTILNQHSQIEEQSFEKFQMMETKPEVNDHKEREIE